MLEPQALASALLPLHAKAASALKAHDDDTIDTTSVSRTPSDTSISSVASSTSGGGDDLFSAPSRASSTRPTTAAGSERGSKQSESVETITIASSSRPRASSAGANSVGSSSSARSNASTIRKQTAEEDRKLTYTDEDWAQDVRWLTPPRMPAASSPSNRRNSRTFPTDFQVSVPPPPDRPPPTRRPGARGKGDRRSRRSRKSQGRMSALWEEDESEDCSTGVSSTEPSRSTTPVPETPPHSLPSSPLAKGMALTTQPDLVDDREPSESTHSESTPDTRLQRYARGQRRSLSTSASLFRSGGSTNANLPTHALPNPSPSEPTTAAPNGYTTLVLPHAGYSNTKGKTSLDGHVDLVRAGVAQSSMVTIEVIRGVAATISHGTATPVAASKEHKRTFSFSLGRTFTLGRKKREGATPAHLQGSLPLAVAFTAHVAPPSFVPESHVLVQVHAVGLDTLDSLIVFDKSGMSGSGGGSGGKGVGGGKAGFIPGRSFVGKVVECGWAVREEVCKRGEWVVGLLDVRKCGALAEFILVERHRIVRAPQPRSRTTTLFPPRRRTHIRSQSLPANGNALPYAHSPLAPPPLTVEELALLPLCGLPAHRAIRTFADVLAPPLGNRPNGSRSDVRALVLQAHDGAGALAVQMLGRRGVRIAVQVPESSMLDESGKTPQNGRKLSIDAVRSSPMKVDKGKDKEGQKTTLSKRARLESRLRAWGVEDICVGDPLDVLHQLAQDGQSFDMVLDTVGGVAMWEAAQRLLIMDWTVAASRSSSSLASRNGSVDLSRDPAAPPAAATTADSEALKPSKAKNKISHAQFTTLVGDTPHRAIPTAHDNLRNGLNSLTRSKSTSGKPSGSAAVLTKGGNKREKRVVGYAWVSVAADVDFEGEDVRDSLGAVMRMAEAGWLRPPGLGGGERGDGEPDEGKVVPFERAPEVFRRGLVGPQGVLADGGTCAVRIVG
ncbi:hypothetical protein L226DRAFT_545971 [Lentinus tigrinus ALCF2SS1-7]|uniref:Uncharacterized protein n=1 Tax=Lentinus tigrinus ALCF2SS1-6 TaxID=1328759 RepID=A0A5C2SE29_9APHY|nr:hypothetical protein L227DRAFT_585328 [Lentinus tigrinus ALCF2SS1-6]RPD74562.1 hypothetical protein L226DRAFT_545971 [Lentinus tigrinus ALCF2SS1-7]